jgi:hypothetical protein
MPRPDSPADPAALAPRVVRGSYLLPVLFFDRTFRWVLALALLAALAVGLLVPRLWRVTPPGWAPPVRISALDWFAARSLRRSARAAQAAGQLPTAVAGWRLVLGRLPTDPEALRALVDLLPAAHRAQPDAGLGPLLDGVGAWLLRLTGTNVADLTAVAASQAERRNWPWIAAQTAAAPAPLPGPLQSLRLAALFELGRLPEFEAAWTHPAAALADDRRAQLYHAAWVALTGRPAGQAARDRLAAAAIDPAWGPTALRLLLPVAQRDLAATAYERHLTALRALGQDGLPEHVNFWSLLWATGQRERAAALADSFGGLPESADEAGPYLDTLLLLRRPALVRAFVRRGLPRLADQPTIWISAAEALLRLEDWEELRALAADLRQQLPLRPLLGNLPDFYDGAAEHGLGHPARAEAAFAALLEKPPARPEFALPPAVHLNRLGYPRLAAQLLAQLRSAAAGAPGFWAQLQQAAYAARDERQLLEASRELYALQPDNPRVANNFVASLILQGDRGPEAVQRAFEVLARVPGQPAARLNWALALLQVGRLDEAAAELARLGGEPLPPDLGAFHHLARCRLARARGQPAEARAAALRVDRRLLFPSQVAEIEAALAPGPGGA